MPSRFHSRILRHVAHENYRPAVIPQMAQELGVEDADLDAFATAIDQLADEGKILINDSSRIELPPFGNEVIGTFRGNARGFGFVVPRDLRLQGDLYIGRDDTLNALTGDIVRAAVRKRPRRPGMKPGEEYSGAVVEILERKRSAFTGELEQRGKQWIVRPDGGTLTAPVIIRDVTNAHVGDKVVFELREYPEGDMLGEGIITKVLGKAGEPDVETQAVIDTYNLPDDFPEECIEQTREVTQTYDEEIEQIEKEGVPEDRLDLRDTFIFTIDPPDAKDYDDAISLERTDNGWKLGVHIADVSHFIPRGSALDVEARERGNSVYLPRLVIPMLPELLSNGICSLQEGVPRYCKSAFIEFDDQGRVLGQGFASTLIHSAKRLTYLEAQALIDGDIKEARKHAKTDPVYTEELTDTLRGLNTLAQRIRERRRKDGMIHLDLPDVELIFDEKGNVIDAEPEDDAFTHTIIEMFMVEANESLARLFEELSVPLLRRVHADPVPGGFDDLRSFVRVAGYNIPKAPTREDLQTLLDATAGTAAAPAVHFAVLRTLTKAEYSPALIGHFALASEAYAHFTSPIRRYPDLTVHRALAEYLAQTKNGQERPKGSKEKRALGRLLRSASDCLEEQELYEIGKKCSMTEQNAADAERELRNLLVMALLADKIGEEFDGVVTGVMKNGVFVQIQKYLVEGLIRTEDLPVDGKWSGRWQMDQRSGALVHSGTGRSFRMGDRVKVMVSQVDLPRRQMELLIPADEAAKREGAGKALKLGQGGGGLGSAQGAGFDKIRTGSQKRSQRSKSRDRRKSDHRQDRKNKGKRQ